MKNIILFLSLSIVFAYCNSQNGLFEIKGTLTDSNEEWIHISEMTSSKIIPIDSTRISNKGEFVLKGLANLPKFILLKLSERNYIILIANKNDVIKITGDTRNLSNTYDLNGSNDSRLIREYMRKLNYTIKEKNKIIKTFQDSSKGTKRESLKRELEDMYNMLLQDQREYTFKFIEDNSFSMASLFVLYQQLGPKNPILNPEEDLKYFELVDSNLTALYPTSPPVQALNKHVTQIREKKYQKQLFDQRLGFGTIAPEISLPSPTGDTILLSSLRGKYVLLDFWAGWCRPCRIENPNLVANYKKYHNKGFEIYQVSLDRTKEGWLKAIEDDKLDWYHVSDLKYWNSAVVPLYQVQGIPANFLLDKEGRIIARNLRGNNLKTKLAEILD